MSFESHNRYRFMCKYDIVNHLNCAKQVFNQLFNIPFLIYAYNQSSENIEIEILTYLNNYTYIVNLYKKFNFTKYKILRNIPVDIRYENFVEYI